MGVLALALALVAQNAGLTLPRRAQDPAGWFRGDSFAQVFVGSFAEGEGQLEAQLEGLDRWVELGVGGLWLVPLPPPAPGGPPISFDRTDPRGAAKEAFSKLAAAAHAKGLAILVEYAPNQVSKSHPWWLEAEKGDRLSQGHFVMREAEPKGWTLPWTFEPKLERWVYHAFSEALPELDLRDRATRETILRGGEEWIQRGADGLRVDAARMLLEDGPGQELDRPDSLRLLSELGERLHSPGAIVAAEASGPRTAGVAFDTERARVIRVARNDGKTAGLLSLFDRAEAAAPSLGGLAPWVPPDSDPLALDLLLLSGGVPMLSAGAATSPQLPALLKLRTAHPALRFGLRFPVTVRGAQTVLAFLRWDGPDRVLVVANLGAAKVEAKLELSGLPLSDRPSFTVIDGKGPLLPSHDKAQLSLAAGELRVYAAASDPRHPRMVFGRGRFDPKATVLEQGLAFDSSRGMGFQRDERGQLGCSGDRCALNLEPRDAEPIRWSMALPPGPYAVELGLKNPAPKGRPILRLEGVPLSGSGKRIKAVAYVRNGRLSLEALSKRAGGVAVELESIQVEPAPFRPGAIEVEPKGDRLVLRAGQAGVVEWRMDRSTSEPCEQAMLIKNGAKFEATLGPWPKGEVSEVGYVIRGVDGRYLTGPEGQELVTHVE